ncbi:MAG: hypothetical protein JEZ09_09125 [Salinivirgaceae bacterium]|nr:hypothetical protein [Salinivirgaceae bacterium]
MKNNKNNPIDIETLMADLQNKDLQYSNLSKRFKVIYLIFVPIYTVIASTELIVDFNFMVLLSSICFVHSMIIFAIIFNRYQKEYRSVNYAEPTLMLLKKAAYRYNPLRKETWWVLTSVAILIIGLAISSSNHGIDLSTAFSFLLGLISGLIVGAIVYVKKYKPLRDNALRLIKEIENN